MPNMDTETLIVPTVEAWADMPGFSTEPGLNFEDDRYYRERLVPDAEDSDEEDPEDVCTMNILVMHY